MFGFFKKMSQQADAINDYFTDAAKLYAFLSNTEAGAAALTAGKVAASGQRQSMIDYCTGLASDIESMAPAEAKRFVRLADAIGEKDWSMRDIAIAKRELGELDEAMLMALNGSDGQYFRRTYPDFFKNF